MEDGTRMDTRYPIRKGTVDIHQSTEERTHERHNVARDQDMPTLHPDDAKDKVFTAILQALMKMGNTPSSPRELANVIVKYKYATLGGATPFATVSSRISQHFKRAAEHNPPRAPLLNKHVDEKHSRKIQYSLATEPQHHNILPHSPTEEVLSDTSMSFEETVAPQHPLYKSNIDGPCFSEFGRRQSRHAYRQKNHFKEYMKTENLEDSGEDDGESDISDYHEEMLKGDETMANIQLTHPAERLSFSTTAELMKRKQSLSGFMGSHELWVSSSFEHDYDDLIFLAHEPSAQQLGLLSSHVTSPEPISVSELESYFANGPSRKSFSSKREWEKPLLQRAPSLSTDHPPKSIPTTHRPTTTLAKTPPKGSAQLSTDMPPPSFSISRRTMGSLRCYELRTKGTPHHNILRFIESTDGASEHIARRTRHADKINHNPRFDLNNGYINATQLRKSAQLIMGKASFDAVAEANHGTAVVTINNGPLETRGAWIPLPRARELAAEYGIEDMPGLATLMSNDPEEGDSSSESDSEIAIDNDRRSNTEDAVAKVAEKILVLSHEDSYFTFDEEEKNQNKDTNMLEDASPLESGADSSEATSPVPVPADFSADTVKSVLTRFPTLESFFKNSDAPHSTSPASPRHVHIPDDPLTFKTIMPTDPPMYITMLEDVAVCVAIFSKTDGSTTQEYRIMRRLDSGHVNGTTLLAAGGIDTESERSMILSFEMDRMRVASKHSPLFGTWIPIRRAQELAVTCSIHDRLGPFLSADLVESYFPSPLPFSGMSKQSDGQMKALGLSMLWTENSKTARTPIPSFRRSPELDNQQILLPKTTLKSGSTTLKVPMFGCFEEDDEHTFKDDAVIVTGMHKQHQQVVPRINMRRSSRYKRASDDLTDDDTDTDTDVEEVRLRMKKIRAAAMEAMEHDQSLDMEELLSHASTTTVSPISEFSPSTKAEKLFKQPNSQPAKEPTLSLGKGNIGPALSKKLADLNGTSHRSKKHSKKSKKKESRKNHNVIASKHESKVSNNSAAAKSAVIEVLPTKVTVKEEDEDEDVDIGGSEEDDDLR